MPNDEPGQGEREAKARERRVSGLISLLMLAGAAVGLLTVLFAHDRKVDLFAMTVPAPVAIASAVLLVVAVAWGSWKYFRIVDEVEVRANQIASTIAMNFYLTLYMAWFVLRRGAVLPEPSHEWLFGSTMLVTLAAYGWKKVRP